MRPETTLLGLIFSAALSASTALAAAPWKTISNVNIFSPPSSYTIPRTLYARSLVLKTDNVLLATWENYSPEPPYFPIFRSADGGTTWTPLSNVTDTQNGWGLRYQPDLYELEVAIGAFPAGTILIAGSSIPADLSITQIELYASQDRGKTWKFVSHVARGGVALPNNGETPVWEPVRHSSQLWSSSGANGSSCIQFLRVVNNQLVIYYSDQRDTAHGQKLVHQASSDLLTWGAVVQDAAYATYANRPGMTTIAKLPNGQYIMTYEFGGSPDGFAAYYRLSTDPLAFNSATGYRITATDGTVPTSSPYVVWTSAGGTNGTIIVSANSNSEVFVNTALAAPGSAWRKIATPQARSYTRSLQVLPDPNLILLAGGGTLGGSTNKVSASVMNITAAL